MRLLPQSDGTLRLRLDADESALLTTLTGQLIDLLHSHSEAELDPDPLFASLEVGGTDSPPEDPALARLFPDAYEGADDASGFRRTTEQGLLNRKLQDAITVIETLGVTEADRSTEDPLPEFDEPQGPSSEHFTEVVITTESMPLWVRTLTALRLAIAARIGLETIDDHARLAVDDQAKSTVYVYDWLAAILDSVLRMMPRASA